MRAQFDRIKQAESQLEQIDGRLREKLAPYAEPMGRLMRIPGVEWITAATIIAEIGVNMSAFVSAEHLASWTGICPGNHRSAGKQKSGKVRKGNVHLKTALVTAAMGAAKTRGGYLREKHRRLRARCGEMRAHVAIAHKILVAAYHILANGSDYQDPGRAPRPGQRTPHGAPTQAPAAGYGLRGRDQAESRLMGRKANHPRSPPLLFSW